MKKRGSSQLLPTPQTSTTSSTWDKADYEDLLLSSELDNSNDNKNLLKSFTLKPPVLKRPRLLRSCSTVRNTTRYNNCKSSWPFRSASCAERFDFTELVVSVKASNSNVDALRLKQALERDFPYNRAIEQLTPYVKGLLFDKTLWPFLLKVSTIYAGDNVQGDRQKRNEIALAAWTTLLRVYAKCRIRGGSEQVERLAIAAVVLQSKLLEESDVDLVKLTRKLTKITPTAIEKTKIEADERKICGSLSWKLLTPSPQVILFLALDVLSGSISIPTSLKLLVSKVLDRLIEEYFVQEYCEGGRMVGDLVRLVLDMVLTDFFSVFYDKKIEISELLEGVLPSDRINVSQEMRSKIERAVEGVVNNPEWRGL